MGLQLDIHFHQEDLPDSLSLGDSIAIDTETMGLNLNRDRLCLVQLSAGDGHCHLVHFPKGSSYEAPNLHKLLKDSSVEKIFHYGRFDLAALIKFFDEVNGPIFCTKIASRLTRTSTDRHSLKHLCRTFLGVEISKEEQTSDWGADKLTDDQMIYAANDVFYLHRLKAEFIKLLEREERTELATSCFEYLPTCAKLDLLGFDGASILNHS